MGVRPRAGRIAVEHLEDEHTINRTIRLSKQAAALLEKESRDRATSENTVVNDLIMRNLRAERGTRQLKMVHLNSMVVKELLESLSDEKIIEIGKNEANDVLERNVLLEVDGIVSPKSVLDVMKLYHDVSESEYNGKKIVIMAHYAGKKYSLLAGTMYKTLFALAGATVEFSIDDNAIIFDLNSVL